MMSFIRSLPMAVFLVLGYALIVAPGVAILWLLGLVSVNLDLLPPLASFPGAIMAVGAATAIVALAYSAAFLAMAIYNVRKNPHSVV